MGSAVFVGEDTSPPGPDNRGARTKDNGAARVSVGPGRSEVIASVSRNGSAQKHHQLAYCSAGDGSGAGFFFFFFGFTGASSSGSAPGLMLGFTDK